DNLQTRFLVNDVCVKHQIPWIYAGAVGTSGMVMPIVPGRTPCLRCLLQSMPGPGVLQTCDTAGVLNTVPAVIASIECTLVYQILTGALDHAQGTSPLILVDGWRHTIDRMTVDRRADCPCCIGGKTDFLDAVSREVITALCGRDAIQILPTARLEISLGELARRLAPLGEVRSHPLMLTFSSGSTDISIFRDGRAIIRGTRDEAVARSLYARYIGL
ncbi:MAG TPA: ThiF family adenylyltransferase, partial [Methanomicrobiales archaeon]|nr:ThiF family adenylyltransferase [Methanomicrobiales archaeon]